MNLDFYISIFISILIPRIDPLNYSNTLHPMYIKMDRFIYF